MIYLDSLDSCILLDDDANDNVHIIDDELWFGAGAVTRQCAADDGTDGTAYGCSCSDALNLGDMFALLVRVRLRVAVQGIEAVR